MEMEADVAAESGEWEMEGVVLSLSVSPSPSLSPYLSFGFLVCINIPNAISKNVGFFCIGFPLLAADLTEPVKSLK